MASRSNGPRPQLLAALGVSVKPASEVTAGRGRLELPALAAQRSEGSRLRTWMRSGPRALGAKGTGQLTLTIKLFPRDFRRFLLIARNDLAQVLGVHTR